MIEVFKTNVKDQEQAKMLVNRIEGIFSDYKANFDLDDCDRILRINCEKGSIQSPRLIDLLKDFGCVAEILPDHTDDQDVLMKIAFHFIPGEGFGRGW